MSACALAWLGEFDDASTALAYVCARRGADLGLHPSQQVDSSNGAADDSGSSSNTGAEAVGASDVAAAGGSIADASDGNKSCSSNAVLDALCTPSQVRYAAYFSAVCDGIIPLPGPLTLKRVMMHGVPDCSPPAQGTEAGGAGTSDGAGLAAAALEALPASGQTLVHSVAGAVTSAVGAVSDAAAADTTGAAATASSGLAAIGRLTSMVLDAADAADAALATGILKAAVAVETAAVKTATLVAHAAADGSGASAGAAASSAEAAVASDGILSHVKEGGASLLSGVKEVVAASAAAARETSLDALPQSIAASGADGGAGASSWSAAHHPGLESVGAAAITTLQSVLAPPDSAAGDGSDGAAKRKRGCRPYLQLFRSGTLVFSSAWDAQQNLTSGGAAATAADASAAPPSASSSVEADEDALASSLPWCDPDDGAVRFPVELPVAGDLLARIRHAGDDGGRETLLRAALHVGFIPHSIAGPGAIVSHSSGSSGDVGSSSGAASGGGSILRLGRRQLDVAVGDDVILPPDFAIELVFGPPSSSSAATAASDVGEIATDGSSLGSDGTGGSSDTVNAGGGSSSTNEAGGTATSAPGGPAAPQHASAPADYDVRASIAAGSSDYDVSLSADAASFWSDVERRREERAIVKRERQQQQQQGLPPVGGPLPASGTGPATADVLGSTKIPASASLLYAKLQPKQPKAPAPSAINKPASAVAAAEEEEQAFLALDGGGVSGGGLIGISSPSVKGNGSTGSALASAFLSPYRAMAAGSPLPQTPDAAAIGSGSASVAMSERMRARYSPQPAAPATTSGIPGVSAAAASGIKTTQGAPGSSATSAGGGGGGLDSELEDLEAELLAVTSSLKLASAGGPLMSATPATKQAPAANSNKTAPAMSAASSSNTSSNGKNNKNDFSLPDLSEFEMELQLETAANTPVRTSAASSTASSVASAISVASECKAGADRSTTPLKPAPTSVAHSAATMKTAAVPVAVAPPGGGGDLDELEAYLGTL